MDERVSELVGGRSVVPTSERRFIDRSAERREIYACMPAVPPTNICHVIYEPGITLCPIYYILCYVDGLAILPDLSRVGRRSRRSPSAWPAFRRRRPAAPVRRLILKLIARRASSREWLSERALVVLVEAFFNIY